MVRLDGCLTDLELAQVRDGTMPEAEAYSIPHLESCGDCQMRYRKLNSEIEAERDQAESKGEA